MRGLTEARDYIRSWLCDVSPSAFGQAVVDFGSSQVISAVSHGFSNPIMEAGLLTTGSIAGLHAVGRMAISGMAWLEQQSLLEPVQHDDFQAEV